MLSTILSFLGLLPKVLDTVQTVTNAIRDEKIVQINAKTDQERIASQERTVQLEARRDVLISEGTNPASAKINACTRLLAASSGILIVMKLLIWDKVVGSFMGCAAKPASVIGCATFNTDPLGADMWGLIMIIFGFYFLARDK